MESIRNIENSTSKKKYVKDLKETKKDDKVEPMMKDITKSWTNNRGSTIPKVEDLKEFIINNVNYKVSGTDVRFEYDEEEKAIAILLSKESGKKIYMLPKINKPDGIPTADYLIDNESYDLKRIYGSGKRTLKDAVKDKKKQSKRFILKITEKSKLSSDEITRQSEEIFRFSETNFVDEIVIIRDDKLMKVLKRG